MRALLLRVSHAHIPVLGGVISIRIVRRRDGRQPAQ